MSSPVEADEDDVEDVEFVSEGPIRPVLECIDLSSDSEDEGCSSITMEDKISFHKARVTSTLDRLAHQVALEKKERANKCRAFKEKQILQKARGQQELAYSSANGMTQEAKRCVDMWLKMPGVQPGVINTGFRRRRAPASFPRNSSTTHTCPVINCGRVYDNASLLDGHLKRFDHSPCDPTIKLKGCPSEFFACAACGQHFQTKEEWRKHHESKVSSPTADGHSITLTYQRIVCFACPACYLFFNLRDECLQHMSAKNHFTESLAMHDTTGRAAPVPVPQYVKNRLITLCKDITFNVRCSLCHKVLISHQAAQAHFNVHCRQGCAVAKADKTVAQVMKQLQVRGQCSLCCQIFLSRAEIESHKESTRHDVEVNQTMQKAVLQHCRFSEIRHTQGTGEAQRKRQSTGVETPFHERNKKRSDQEKLPAKRQRLNGNVDRGRNLTTAWRCECGLQFSEEAAASLHLLAVNQIFHQCGVCGKHMGEPSITRLHMSRFHGGAHLSNFLFYCRKCRVEMPRHEDILSHVSEAHSGHTYFAEQEVPREVADAKPSTSVPRSSSKPAAREEAAETTSSSSSKAEQTWMCRMCEDVFDSEADVHRHCSDVNGHSYQRFMCGHCPQKFFKESTVRRHCVNEHNGEIRSSHFCGLCDSMQFDSEAEFLEHYKCLHSRDYYRMDGGDVVQPAVAESAGRCPCMGSEKSKDEIKATYTQCMRDLAGEGKCHYVCGPCGVRVASYPQMKTHVHTKHAALNLDKTFDVECQACQESFGGVPSFHRHYHSRHCTLEPCVRSGARGKDREREPGAVKIIDAVEITSDTDETEDDTTVKFLKMKFNSVTDECDDEMSVSAEDERESADLDEALKRSMLEF